MTSILMYVLIFVAKVTEVSMATTRIVLITKGEKLKGAFIGFFEVLIWVVLVSTVLKDITSDPLKILIYALGFSTGNYVGSIFEQKLGIGTVRIEAIVMEHHGDRLVDELRESGLAVTVIDAKGMNCDRQVLIMHVKRKRLEEVTKKIRLLQGNVVITVNEIKAVYGGFGLIKK